MSTISIRSRGAATTSVFVFAAVPISSSSFPRLCPIRFSTMMCPPGQPLMCTLKMGCAKKKLIFVMGKSLFLYTTNALFSGFRQVYLCTASSSHSSRRSTYTAQHHGGTFTICAHLSDGPTSLDPFLSVCIHTLLFFFCVPLKCLTLTKAKVAKYLMSMLLVHLLIFSVESSGPAQDFRPECEKFSGVPTHKRINKFGKPRAQIGRAFDVEPLHPCMSLVTALPRRRGK